MLRRLRLAFRCGVLRLGPLLVTLAALAVLGLGAHAALDWHRHGEAGAGFFHLHVHFGEHHHHKLTQHHHDEYDDRHGNTADHDHGELDHQEHESPEPDPSSQDRRECGTLTLVFGVDSAPKIAPTERLLLATREHVSNRNQALTDREVETPSWSPRGPPV